MRLCSRIRYFINTVYRRNISSFVDSIDTWGNPSCIMAGLEKAILGMGEAIDVHYLCNYMSLCNHLITIVNMCARKSTSRHLCRRGSSVAGQVQGAIFCLSVQMAIH